MFKNLKRWKQISELYEGKKKAKHISLIKLVKFGWFKFHMMGKNVFSKKLNIF